MQVHLISPEEIEHLKLIEDKTAIRATPIIEGKPLPAQETLTEEARKSLLNGEPLTLAFSLSAMGVRMGIVTLYLNETENEKAARWDLQYESASLDRFASVYRNRDWKHGLVGSTIRGVWRAAAENRLDQEEKIAGLLQPSEVTAVRYDSSKEREKDRTKDLPLVNQ